MRRDRKIDARIFRHHHGKMDLLTLKHLNAMQILDTVRASGPISRAALARHSQLSPPTVSAQVDHLIRLGLLTELGRGKSRGGRPPILLKFNQQCGVVAGVDLGATNLRMVLADLNGEILHRRVEPTHSSVSYMEVIEQIHDGIRELVEEMGLPSSLLLAAAVGAPGITDVERGVVLNAANLNGWIDVPLRDELERRLGINVAIDNDVNMAALGELWRGHACGLDNFVFVALGTGIGAGIVLDGTLHRGSNWFAGEICHMNLDYREWNTNFGDQGYLESQVGSPAIRRLAARLAEHHETVLPTEIGAISPELIFQAAEDGDFLAREVLDRLSILLGTSLANITTLLDPEMVVFGGGISQLGKALIEPVRRVVAKIIPNPPRIELSKLADQAQVYGCLETALELADLSLYECIAGRARSLSSIDTEACREELSGGAQANTSPPVPPSKVLTEPNSD